MEYKDPMGVSFYIHELNLVGRIKYPTLGRLLRRVFNENMGFYLKENG